MKGKKKKKEMRLKNKIVLTLLYILLFVVVFSFIDFYDYYAINPYLLTILSVIFGSIASYIHIVNGQKNTMDDMAEKL